MAKKTSQRKPSKLKMEMDLIDPQLIDRIISIVDSRQEIYSRYVQHFDLKPNVSNKSIQEWININRPNVFGERGYKIGYKKPKKKTSKKSKDVEEELPTLEPEKPEIIEIKEKYPKNVTEYDPNDFAANKDFKPKEVYDMLDKMVKIYIEWENYYLWRVQKDRDVGQDPEKDPEVERIMLQMRVLEGLSGPFRNRKMYLDHLTKKPEFNELVDKYKKDLK